MTVTNTNLIAARAALALASAALDTSTAALARGRDIQAAAAAEVQRHVDAASTAEGEFAEDLAAAISRGSTAPDFIANAAAYQARHSAECKARIAAAAVARLEEALAAAKDAHDRALAALKSAVSEILDAEATELVSRRRTLRAELRELDDQLKGFEAAGGRLPLEVDNINENNWLNFSVSALNEKFNQRLLEGTARTPASYFQHWHARRAALLDGPAIDNAAPSEAAA